MAASSRNYEPIELIEPVDPAFTHFAPDRRNTPHSELTSTLFDALLNQTISEEELEQTLNSSLPLRAIESFKLAAINLTAFKTVTKDKKNYGAVSPLSLAIRLNCKDYFHCIYAHIKNEYHEGHISKDTLNEVLLNALAHAILDENINIIMELLSDRLVDLNSGMKCCLLKIENHVPSLRYAKNMVGTILPIAIFKKNIAVIETLLFYGADPNIDIFPDSAGRCRWGKETVILFAAGSVLHLRNTPDIYSQYQDIENCSLSLIQAIAAYCENKDAAMHKHLAAAIEKNILFTRNFLKTQAQFAVDQLTTHQHDETDYRYLLPLIRAFAFIVQTSRNMNYPGTYQNFQQETIAHIFGAYDCTIEVPNKIQKLWVSNELKGLYFHQPVCPPLLEGLVAATTMTAKPSANKSQWSPTLLHKSSSATAATPSATSEGNIPSFVPKNEG